MNPDETNLFWINDLLQDAMLAFDRLSPYIDELPPHLLPFAHKAIDETLAYINLSWGTDQ